jgi:DinB superfamily
METTRDELLGRLDAVKARLDRLVAEPTPGLTDPDEGTGERWEAGQVWAHIAEFVPYWLGELDRVVTGAKAPGDPDPVRYGRTKTDPGRIAGIERHRRTDPRALLARATADIARIREFISGLAPEAWGYIGLHPTRGEVPVSRIVQGSVVDHLEEHADQLEGLAREA